MTKIQEYVRLVFTKEKYMEGLNLFFRNSLQQMQNELAVTDDQVEKVLERAMPLYDGLFPAYLVLQEQISAEVLTEEQAEIFVNVIQQNPWMINAHMKIIEKSIQPTMKLGESIQEDMEVIIQEEIIEPLEAREEYRFKLEKLTSRKSRLLQQLLSNVVDMPEDHKRIADLERQIAELREQHGDLDEAAKNRISQASCLHKAGETEAAIEVYKELYPKASPAVQQWIREELDNIEPDSEERKRLKSRFAELSREFREELQHLDIGLDKPNVPPKN